LNIALSSRLQIIGQAMLASPFLFSGVTKIMDFGGAVAEVQSLTGLAPAPLFAGLVILAQLGGGLALLTSGRLAVLGGLLLASFTIVATLVGHQFWSRSGTEFVHEATTFFEHVALVAGLILVPWLADRRGRDDHHGG